ncbi:MAG: hypothetical protein AB1505_32270 [Candidatus Latescibacterota bacterium]
MTDPVPVLEDFFRAYVETAQGEWEQVEPQVYDVLLPPEAARALGLPPAHEVLRVAFDPEAVPEHPGAQLLTYGSPLLDRILGHAQGQGPVARVFLAGIVPVLHGAEGRVEGGLRVPEGCRRCLGVVRTLYFGHAAFWFRATFRSDDKAQENYVNVVDLHYGRFAHHLEEMLRAASLPYAPSDERPLPWPDASRLPLAEACAAARERVIRTAAAVAQGHRVEQQERLQRQVARMQRYYQDVRAELALRLERARQDRRLRTETVTSLEERLQGTGREEQLRIAELRQRAALSMELELLNLLLISYPKCQIPTRLEPRRGQPLDLELVWDPLTSQVEPAACPRCGRPTREVVQGERYLFGCPECWGPAR